MSRTMTVRTTFTLLTLALLAVPVAAAGPHPLEVAAHFLALSPEQLAQLITLEQAVHETAAPVVQEIAQRRTLLGQLIDSDEPNPAEIGVLLLSIRALEQQLANLYQEAGATYREILDDEQRERLQAAAAARPLCQVVPALTALHLL